jgi:hypothetical protein
MARKQQTLTFTFADLGYLDCPIVLRVPNLASTQAAITLKRNA